MSTRLYPNYRPIGVKREWDHTSMTCDSAGDVLRRYSVPDDFGDPSEAVAWFAENGGLRVLVADYPNGRRAELRINSRGSRLSLVTPEPHP